MSEKNENYIRDVGVLVLNIALASFILFKALSGFDSRDMSLGFLLLVANVFFSASFLFLYKNKTILKYIFITNLIVHTALVAYVVFSDASPLVNRVTAFLIIDFFIAVVFTISFKIRDRKLKKNQLI